MKTRRVATYKMWFKANILTVLIILSVVLGIITGLTIRVGLQISISKEEATYLGFPGQILLRTLKGVATPLIVTCIVVAIGTMNIFVIKTVGFQMLILVLATKVVVVSISMSLTAIIGPGKGGGSSYFNQTISAPSIITDIFLDLFRNIIPDNMMNMYIMQYKTQLFAPKGTETYDYNAWIPKPGVNPGINLLGVIFIFIVIGVCLTLLRTKGHAFLEMMTGVFKVSMMITMWIVWAAPVLLFFLIMTEILKIPDFGVYATTWGIFLLTVLLCHAVALLIIDPLYLLLIAQTNPLRFYADMAQALVTAFATASSIVTMPLLIDGLVKNGIDRRLVNFVVPVLLNVSKDGTSAFLAVGTVGIAQMSDAKLNVGEYGTILLLCCMGSVAAAAVPFSGIVVIIMILNGLGLDDSAVGTIMAMFWLIDRGDTTVNVLGIGILTKILAKWNEKLIKQLPEEEN